MTSLKQDQPLSYYRAWLQTKIEESGEELGHRSLRGFAKRAAMSPGSLSEILSGKRKLTLASVRKIAESLELPPDQCQTLYHAVEPALSQQARQVRKSLGEVYPLEADEFKVISDWHHYALLCLLEIPTYRSDEGRMALKLGITRSMVNDSLRRLMSLGLVDLGRKGWLPTNRRLSTRRDVASLAVRKCQRQLLRKAEASLTSDPLEERAMSTVTMAIDPSRLDEAKDLIAKFRRDLSAFLEQGEQSRVYTCAIQLFPLDKEVDR